MVREKCVLDFSSQMALVPQIMLGDKGVLQRVRNLLGIFLDYLLLILLPFLKKFPCSSFFTCFP